MDRGSDGTSIDGLKLKLRSPRGTRFEIPLSQPGPGTSSVTVSPDVGRVTRHVRSLKFNQETHTPQGAALISRNIRRPELRSLRSRLVVVARCDASTARRASDHVRSWLEHPLVPHQSSFTPQRDHAHTPHLPAHRRPQRRGATHVSVDTPGPAAAVITAPEAAADLRRSLSRSPPSRPSGVEGGRILLKAFRRRRPWH
jgi:hypothetical protein